jgi:hypothetical protein
VTLVPRPFWIAVSIGFLLFGCGPDRAEEQQRAEWMAVQELRRQYSASTAEQKVEAKQQWADAVHAFLKDWPDHPAARRTWNELQLDYAEQLEVNGRFAEAEVHYGSLVEREEDHRRAREGLERVRRRQALSRDDIAKLEKGMEQTEVVRLIGPPTPGWERSPAQGDGFESWYYQTADNEVRGVHFRNGRLFATDLD